MNGYAVEFPSLVIATLTLSLSALAASLLLWKLKPSSPRIHRMIWIAVLINGVILWRLPLDVPVLDPVNLDQAQLSVELVNQSDNGSQLADNRDSTATSVRSNERVVRQTRFPESTVAANELKNQQLSGIAAGNLVKSRKIAWLPEWRTMLLFFWLAGVVVTLLILGRRYLRVFNRLSHSRPAKISWQVQLDQVVHEFKLRRQVPLLVHPSIGPLLIATPFQSRIVVPAQFWQQLSPLQRRAILNHEVAHLVRRDIWFSMFAAGLATVHWFNPLSWIALRNFNRAAEWACDQHAGVKDSPERTGFARALLSLSSGDPGFLVGASRVASTNLVSRVERLLVDRSEDPATKKVLLSLLIAGIILLGWFNVRLVTAEPPTPAVETGAVMQEEDGETKSRIQSLAERIVAGDDELANSFSEIIQTPAGEVAVSNRLGVIRNQMRREASKSLIDEYFTNQLQGNFLEKMNSEVALAKQDIETIDSAFDQLRSKLAGESEADKLLTRLLDNEKAAGVVYFSQFRTEIRPGKRQVLQRLGRFLARDENGKFVVRESIRDEFVQQLKQFDGIDKQLEIFGKELRNWSEEIAPKDAMHERIKTGLARPESAARILAAIQGNEEVDESIERYFRFLEQILVDTADGLVIREDQRDFLKTSIASADLQNRKIDLLRQPVQEIANAIEVRGEAERLAKDFMLTEFGLNVLVKDIDAGMTTPESITEKIKMQVLEETDDGNLQVREDRQEEVIKFAREMLSNTRRIRRQTMAIDEAIEKLDEGSLKTVCDSIEGRMILMEDIKEHADSIEYDAWSRWIESVFDESGDSLSIRSESRNEISTIIEEAKNIEQELQKDDF